jgi:hypothetical protein
MVLDRSKRSHGAPGAPPGGAVPVGDFGRTLPGSAQLTDGFLGEWEREEDNGSIYYYNSRTHESQWLAPEGAYVLQKLPGTVGTHALVLGPGVASAAEEQAAAPVRPCTSAPATRRPSLAATLQSGAAMMGSALASFRQRKHALENRDIIQAKQDAKDKAKADRAMQRVRREALGLYAVDKDHNKKSTPDRKVCMYMCRASAVLRMRLTRVPCIVYIHIYYMYVL